ncbi:MAG TPA: PDZ domain-containing protein [Gemmatimonadaceae bacterium]|nr:PDZ domain-containing protein [Gemmatimonadaceae bacterium]
MNVRISGSWRRVAVAAAILSAALTAGAAALRAQIACAPGIAYGITGYQCANCGASVMRDSVRTIYTFGAEPVVVEATPTTYVRAGDVVVAVNGNPITTRAGADLFAYPPRGVVALRVRRNGVNVDLSINTEPRMCGALLPLGDSTLRVTANAMLRGSAGTGSAGGGFIGGARSGGTGGGAAAGGRMGGRGVPPDSLRGRTQTLDAVASRGDSLRSTMIARTPIPEGVAAMAQTQTSTVELRNFGLVLACRPSCTRARSRDGQTYWRFDGYPAVGASMATRDGLAAKAGLREGDVIISINGLSPLTEEGSLLLNRTDRELTITVEISRVGKRDKYVLKL